MQSRYRLASILFIFFVVLFGISLAFGSSFVSVIAGEDSVGSWMSGVLLVISSITTAFIASKRGWYPWAVFATFFMLLAIDENFMIHEAMKRMLVFTRYEATDHPVYWVGELPVMIAALIGAFVARIMSRNINRDLRWLIAGGVIFGTASVIIDVLTMGVLWEDGFKLIAELAVTCALVTEAQNIQNRNE